MTGIQFIVQQMSQLEVKPKKSLTEKRTVETHLEPYASEILSDSKSGLSLLALAGKYDVARPTMQRFLTLHGVYIPTRKDRRIAKKRLIHAIEAGEMTVKEVAQKMNVAKQTVFAWVRAKQKNMESEK